MTSLESLEPRPAVKSRRRLAGDTAALVGAQLVGLAATLALTPVQLDRMGYERYGLISLAVAAVGVFTFLDYGLSWAVLRYVPSLRIGDRPDQAREVASYFVSAALVAGVLVSMSGAAVVLVAALLGYELVDGDRLSVLVFCLLMLPVMLSSNVLSNVARSLGHFRAAALVFGGYFLTTNVIWAVAAGRSHDVEFVLGSQILYSCGATLFWYRLIRRVAFRIKLFPQLSSQAREHRTAMLRFAAYSAVAGLSASLFLAGDKIAFASGIGVKELPYYAIAVALCSRIAIMASSLTGVAFPQLSAAHAAEDVGEYTSLSQWALRATTLSTAAVAAGVFWVGSDFFGIWISSGFADATDTVIRALAVGFAIQAVGQLGYAANDARGRVRRTMLSGLSFGTAGVVAAGLVAGRYGLEAGATVFAAALGGHGLVGVFVGYGFPTRRTIVEAGYLTLPPFVAVGVADRLAHVSGAGALGALVAAGVVAAAVLLLQARVVLLPVRPLQSRATARSTVRKD